MKRFVSKVQNLGQKAAQIQQAIQSVPPKISQISESVAVTAGQLQQLRSTLQSSVTSLKMENPDHILEALREIHDASNVFAEAGYGLAGIDMELSPVQRLIVLLEKVEDVAHPVIRGLIAANQNQKTVHALLTSLLQAEAVADRVALSELTYRTLAVNVGPIPSVRLCWRAEDEEEAPVTVAPHATTAAAPATPLSAPSAFSQSSYFEARSIPAQSSAPASSAPVGAPPSAASATPALPSESPMAATPSVDWKTEALERLKRNPHASKYSR